LSLKIILIQKFQISVFVKYLNLTEFENVFGLNLNFEIKFKKAAEKELQSVSIFSLVAQFNLAHVPLKPSGYFEFICISWLTSATTHSAFGPISARSPFSHLWSPSHRRHSPGQTPPCAIASPRPFIVEEAE
jgi:hypothetical protein